MQVEDTLGRGEEDPVSIMNTAKSNRRVDKTNNLVNLGCFYLSSL